MHIISKIVNAVSAAGIPCLAEYSANNRYDVHKSGFHAFAGMKKLGFARLRAGLADVSAEVRVTLTAAESSADGSVLLETAEKIVLPAVMGCGEEIYSAEISEVKHDTKKDRLYCEIIFTARRDGYGICG